MLKRQYDMLQTQLESERRETGRLMQIIESLRTEVARRDGEKGVREVHRESRTASFTYSISCARVVFGSLKAFSLVGCFDLVYTALVQ